MPLLWQIVVQRPRFGPSIGRWKWCQIQREHERHVNNDQRHGHVQISDVYPDCDQIKTTKTESGSNSKTLVCSFRVSFVRRLWSTDNCVVVNSAARGCSTTCRTKIGGDYCCRSRGKKLIEKKRNRWRRIGCSDRSANTSCAQLISCCPVSRYMHYINGRIVGCHHPIATLGPF